MNSLRLFFLSNFTTAESFTLTLYMSISRSAVAAPPAPASTPAPWTEPSACAVICCCWGTRFPFALDGCRPASWKASVSLKATLYFPKHLKHVVRNWIDASSRNSPHIACTFKLQTGQRWVLVHERVLKRQSSIAAHFIISAMTIAIEMLILHGRIWYNTRYK